MLLFSQSGQSEQEKETNAFLGTAFMIAIGLIFLILVLQFNSMSKPFIVITEIFFSVIGVLIGYACHRYDHRHDHVAGRYCGSWRVL